MLTDEGTLGVQRLAGAASVRVLDYSIPSGREIAMVRPMLVSGSGATVHGGGPVSPEQGDAVLYGMYNDLVERSVLHSQVEGWTHLGGGPGSPLPIGARHAMPGGQLSAPSHSSVNSGPTLTELAVARSRIRELEAELDKAQQEVAIREYQGRLERIEGDIAYLAVWEEGRDTDYEAHTAQAAELAEAGVGLGDRFRCVVARRPAIGRAGHETVVRFEPVELPGLGTEEIAKVQDDTRRRLADW